jgi:glucose/arabinose dehydrogenase
LQYGANPDLPQPRRGLLPDMKISLPAAWGDDLPTVPQGFKITAIATDLAVLRQTLVLPNGDILIAEGSVGGAPALRPKDIIANYIKGLGTLERIEDLPAIPREVEDILTISTTKRHRWLKDGRLKAQAHVW